ncbi:MAG: hypothetical protein HYY17_11595 [Planctomycetes bacterium]|nr:hypothetical protein [Planctomycetota bacterium]
MRVVLRQGEWTYELVGGREAVRVRSQMRFRDREHVRVFLASFLSDPVHGPSLVAGGASLTGESALSRYSPAERIDLIVDAVISGRVRVLCRRRTGGSGGAPPQEKAPAAAPAPAPATERRPVDLWVRLDVDPNDASNRSDKFVVLASDGSYRQVKTVKDDKVPGDRYVDLQYTGLYEDLSYTLQVEEPGAAPYRVFENVPYSGLAGLSPSVARAVAAGASEPGESDPIPEGRDDEV